MLEPEFAVSPIEHINSNCGKRTVARALKNSLKIYTEIQEAAVLPAQTHLLFPVLFDNADEFMTRMSAEIRETLKGVIFFEGIDNLSIGARFDAIRQLR